MEISPFLDDSSATQDPILFLTYEEMKALKLDINAQFITNVTLLTITRIGAKFLLGTSGSLVIQVHTTLS